MKNNFYYIPAYSVDNGKCTCNRFNCTSQGKHPIINDWPNNSSNDPKQIEQWKKDFSNCNMAIHCEKSDVIVLDLDMHQKDKNGYETLKQLEQENEKLPKTITVNTGGGGQHLYFIKPKGVEGFKGTLGAGIDVKFKGYTIAPPSNHISGKNYEWAEGCSPDDIEIAELPDWVVNLIKVENKPKKISVQSFNNDTHYEATNNDFYSDQIIERCSFIKHWTYNSSILPEGEWYLGISVLCYASDGNKKIHEYSKNYPGYSFEETEAKILHAQKATTGPMTCEGIQDKTCCIYCKDCPYKKDLKTPLFLGKKQYKIQNLVSDNNIEFPLESLPQITKDYVLDATEAIKAPMGYFAATILASFSIAIGNNFKIQITASWQQSANIFAVLIGKPGSKKSPALKEATRHLKAIAQKYDQDYKLALKEYEKDIKNYNKQFSSKNPSDIEEPKKPYRTNVFSIDTTTEALAEQSSRNPKGIGIVCDELTQLLRSMNQYKSGKGTDRTYFLYAWNNDRYYVDRKGKESIIVDNLFHTIIGGIQPDNLKEINLENNAHDGFIDRFLFIYPEHKDEGNLSFKKIDPNTNNKISNCMRKIYEQKHDKVYNLSSEAFSTFETWYKELTERNNTNQYPEIMRGYLEKQKAYTARLALILHCIKLFSNETSSEEVEANTIEQAVMLSEYFIQNALKVFANISKSHYFSYESKVLEWLKLNNLEQASAREIQRGLGGQIKASLVKQTLENLENDGYGVCCKKERGQIIFHLFP